MPCSTVICGQLVHCHDVFYVLCSARQRHPVEQGYNLDRGVVCLSSLPSGWLFVVVVVVVLFCLFLFFCFLDFVMRIRQVKLITMRPYVQVQVKTNSTRNRKGNKKRKKTNYVFAINN